MTRLSCHRFRANEVRLWLSVIAYNLGNLWRRLALPAPIGKWSLTSLQQRLVMMVSNCTSCSDVLGSAFYVLGVGNPLFGGLLDLGCERHAKTAARSAARGKFSATDPVIDCIRRDPEKLCDPFYV